MGDSLLGNYPWLSILPPMIAIGFAIATRRVLVSLAMSIFAGAIILAYDGLVAEEAADAAFPYRFVHSAWHEQLWPALESWDHQRVFIFSLTLGAMVGVIEATGGMTVLVDKLRRRVKTRRGGQGLVWLLGLAIFFDDYANSLLLGTTMRPTADRLRISRAKLAYLVDSTAAPVAGLALVSTWVATEIDMIGEGLKQANVGEDVSAFAIFLASIPYRFYAILALVMVAVVAWTGRDFGSMLAEERRSQGTLPSDESAGAVESSSASEAGEQDESAVGRQLPDWLWLAAVCPVVVCVSIVLGVLLQSGTESVGETELTGIQYWGAVFSAASSYDALMWGSVSGLAFAALLSVAVAWQETSTWSRGATLPRIADVVMVGGWNAVWGALRGAAHIFPAMLILWLAWSLSGMTDESLLNTGGFLRDTLEHSGLPDWLLPTAVFITSGFVALSTGTSWGTMTLLTPLAVQLAVAAGVKATGSDALLDGGPLLLPMVGAVLAGAIFGDHCSPISDTTVLSSRASGCDHVLHVRTQMPYALAVGGITIVLCTLPSGLGVSAWWSLVAAIAMIWIGMMLVGQRADRPVGQET